MSQEFEIVDVSEILKATRAILEAAREKASKPAQFPDAKDFQSEPPKE